MSESAPQPAPETLDRLRALFADEVAAATKLAEEQAAALAALTERPR